jgi:hypothetical protein
MKPTPKDPQAYHAPQVTDYHAPLVTDYGNIKQITMKVGRTGGSDGGSWPTSRTRA